MYTLIRILQRLSLLVAGLLSFLYCAFLLSESFMFDALQQTKSYQGFTNADSFNSGLHTLVNALALNAAIAIAWSVVLTACLLYFKRERAADKKMFIDSGAILLFCTLTTLLAQIMLQGFYTRLATSGL